MSHISSSLSNQNQSDAFPQYDVPFLGDQGKAFIQANRNVGSVYGSGVHNSVYRNVSVTNEPGKEPDGSLIPGTAVLGGGATMISAQIYHGGTLQVNNRGLLWGGTVSCNGTVTLLGGTMNGNPGVGDAGGNNQILGGTVLVENGGVVANGTAWGAWVNGAEASPTTAYLSVGAGGTANGERIWQGASADFGAGARGNTIID